MGLPLGKVKAHLDKVLIYEKGQFFLPHQDSEKKANMLASLVVLLPSPHKGGALVVSHHGETKKYSAHQCSANKAHAFSFYSDCHHEIKKVTEGYRVALTYHITVEPSHKKNLSAEGDEWGDIKPLKAVVESYFRGPPIKTYRKKAGGEQKKFVYLLDHQYTPKGLSPSTLKSKDRIVFHAFKKVAEELNCDIALALADLHECWSCEPEDDFYGSYYEDDWDIDTRDGSSQIFTKESQGYELDEMVDSSIELNHWKSCVGKGLRYGVFSVDESELSFTKATSQFVP